MLSRLVLGFSFFMSALMAAPVTATEDEQLTQTVFELERSVAILQLSKANLDDYQTMHSKVVSLESRVSFLGNVTFLLCVGLVIVFFQLHRQKKRFLFLEERLESRSLEKTQQKIS
ncbi:hypothetical protein [Marinomonas colpomeniae]|uniref:CcmD family protein n=1 Tax=Marinomonas colpomeniae TaxID=2774408 RepID=A0ABR8P123_9GAMM|nr:hypothetical protein [Marinomonas colpomeniae]MBD5770987.1 hypothetical protein [Marinomonas colpomeniae]